MWKLCVQTSTRSLGLYGDLAPSHPLCFRFISADSDMLIRKTKTDHTILNQIRMSILASESEEINHGYRKVLASKLGRFPFSSAMGLPLAERNFLHNRKKHSTLKGPRLEWGFLFFFSKGGVHFGTRKPTRTF